MESDTHANTPVLVTFARAEESRAFRRKLTAKRAARVGGVDVTKGTIGQIEVIVAHTGIGAASAKAVISSLLGERRWWLVIGAGFAGGLDPKLRAGDVVIEEHPHATGPQRIVSSALPVERVEEKAALFSETKAQAVDMETATLATECARAALPIVAVRAISDAADTALPVPFAIWFDVAAQRVRPLRLLGHLIANPRSIGPFARFVRALPRVSNALAMAIEGSIRALEHH
jgi:adenosylhomocysteine nucleosidase